MSISQSLFIYLSIYLSIYVYFLCLFIYSSLFIFINLSDCHNLIIIHNKLRLRRYKVIEKVIMFAKLIFQLGSRYLRQNNQYSKSRFHPGLNPEFEHLWKIRSYFSQICPSFLFYPYLYLFLSLSLSFILSFILFLRLYIYIYIYIYASMYVYLLIVVCSGLPLNYL